MSTTKVYYHLSHYISHKTTGLDYIEAIKNLGFTIVDDNGTSDVIIIHDDPLNYQRIISSFINPAEKRIIAYSVWETEKLPRQYLNPLKMVDEIWTCSPFSAISFSEHFHKVKVVPHIVRKNAPGHQDLDYIKTLLHHANDSFYFYTVADSINPRKNLKSLLEVFLKNFSKATDVFLVVKQYRHALDISSLPRTINISHDLSAGEMSALHAVCDCFVSLHHAEAWGLSISDAMAAGNPVIATGYSGNMHYMHETNSHPVKYSLDTIFPTMCDLIPLYAEDMIWAYPDMRHAAYLMKKVIRQGSNKGLAENAKRSMERFSPENVSRIIAAHLASNR